MNTVLKAALITIATNVTIILLIIISNLHDVTSRAILSFFAAIFLLLFELILGLVIAASENNKSKGQGILIAVGVSLLIGLSVCSAA